MYELFVTTRRYRVKTFNWSLLRTMYLNTASIARLNVGTSTTGPCAIATEVQWKTLLFIPIYSDFSTCILLGLSYLSHNCLNKQLKVVANLCREDKSSSVISRWVWDFTFPSFWETGFWRKQGSNNSCYRNNFLIKDWLCKSTVDLKFYHWYQES